MKDQYNKALIHNTEVQALHDQLEGNIKIDKEKLEEMKKNYDPKSEQIFNTTWDLSDSYEDDTIVKNLYEDLSNLKIQNDSEDEDNSSIETVIQNVKKEDVPQTAAPCSPILGGQVYDENHPPHDEEKH